MTRGGPSSVPCRDGCGVQLIFARRYGGMKTWAYEAEDRDPFSDAAVGAHVLIDGVAFTLREAIEHFHTSGAGRSEAAARELVSGYPAHRAHHHEPPDPTGDNAA